MRRERGVLVTAQKANIKIVNKMPVKAQTSGTSFNYLTMKYS